MREAGLPVLVPDAGGERTQLMGAKGVVRAIYPERWRVDIETEEGSLITEALVVGPYFPQLHADGQEPSHVGYLQVGGGPEALCWPMPHRRLLAPTDRPKDAGAEEQPERRYFHLHRYIFRSGNITMRITTDERLVFESEAGDYILFDTQTRTVEVQAPTVFLGTDAGTRVEYQRDTELRLIMPKILLGDQALLDTDGITYLKDTLLHLVSPEIKLTSSGQIILDPPTIKFGNENASEPLVLGNQWLALYNAFINLFNNHVHTNVQTGSGVSGPPQTPSVGMTDAQLSDIAYVSKDGL
jgi:hypothetical protein